MFRYIQFLHYVDYELSADNKKMAIETAPNTNIDRYFLTLSQREKEVFIIRQAMVLAYLSLINGENPGISFKTFYEELRKLGRSYIESPTAKVISERLFGWYGRDYQDQDNFSMQTAVEEYMSGYPHLPGKMPNSVWVPFYLFSLMSKAQADLDIPLGQLALPILSETKRTQIVQGQGSEHFRCDGDNTKEELSPIKFAASFIPKSDDPVAFLLRLARTAGSEEDPTDLHLLFNIIRGFQGMTPRGPKYGSLGLKGRYSMNITRIGQVFRSLYRYRDQGILADTQEARCVIDNYITALSVELGCNTEAWAQLNEQARSLDLLPGGTSVPTASTQVKTALENFHSAFLENEKLYDPDADEPLPPEIRMEAEEDEAAPEEDLGEEEGGEEPAKDDTGTEEEEEPVDDDTAGDGETTDDTTEEETEEEPTISRTQASIAERVKSILGFSPKIAKTTTMSDVMFRDMVGKRVDAILDQQPQDFSADELDLLRHIRLHWLYLVDLENLVILLERLFAGKTTTLQG